MAGRLALLSLCLVINGASTQDLQGEPKLLVGVFDITHHDCRTQRTFGVRFKNHFLGYIHQLNNKLSSQGGGAVRGEVVDTCSSAVTSARRIMFRIFAATETPHCSQVPHGIIGPGGNDQIRAVLDMTSSFNITHASYGVMESDIASPAPDSHRYHSFKNVRTSSDVVLSQLCQMVKSLSWHYISISVTSHDILNVNLCEGAHVDMSVSVLLRSLHAGNRRSKVALLTSPFLSSPETQPPLVTLVWGEMSLSDIRNFTLALEELSTLGSLPAHIWVVSEQFLLSFIDLHQALPDIPRQIFLCYHSPPDRGSSSSPGASSPGASSPDAASFASLEQHVSDSLNLKYFISLAVDEVMKSPGQSNTAQGQSNTAQGQSNTAQGQSNTAQGQSNTAQLIYLDKESGRLVKAAWTTVDEKGKLRVAVDESVLEQTGIRDLGVSVCNPGCPTGQVKFERPGDPGTCYRCRDCDVPNRQVSGGGANTSCTTCNTTHKPSSDRSTCTNITPQPFYYTQVGGVLLMTLSLLGILGVLLTTAVFLRNKAAPIIRAANRELCYVIFIGLITCFAAVFTMVLPPGPTVCKLRLILLSLGASLTVTTIMGRAIRIIRIFTATHVTMDTLLVSLRDQAVFIGAVVGLETGLAAWAALQCRAGVYVEEDPADPSDDPKVHTVCTPPDMTLLAAFLAVFLGLCLVTSVISFQARKLPTNYNEVAYTYFTVFTIDIITVSSLSVFYTTQVKLTVISAATVTLITAYLILFLLFFNKVYIIYFNPDQNKIHNIPESPTLKLRRHRRESTRLVPALIPPSPSNVMRSPSNVRTSPSNVMRSPSNVMTSRSKLILKSQQRND